MMGVAVRGREILAVAEQLFADRGFDGVSMQQIAEGAEVSKANIYHHFQSKEALYLAVLKHAFEDMKVLLNDLQQGDELSVDQLARFSAEHLRDLHAKSTVTRLILRELLDGDGSRGRLLAEQVFAEYFELLRNLLVQCQSRGEVRQDVDVDHMAAALVGLNVFLFQAWPAMKHLPDAAFDDQQTSGAKMFALLYRGLLPAGEEAAHA